MVWIQGHTLNHSFSPFILPVEGTPSSLHHDSFSPHQITSTYFAPVTLSPSNSGNPSNPQMDFLGILSDLTSIELCLMDKENSGSPYFSTVLTPLSYIEFYMLLPINVVLDLAV